MPFVFEYIAVRSQVADNSADFMGMGVISAPSHGMLLVLYMIVGAP
jgi:hypothetical protein